MTRDPIVWLPDPAQVGAVDVQYADDGRASPALVVRSGLDCSTVVFEGVALIDQTEPYEPGALYKRELPCIEAVLTLGPRLDLLIVDGYATLDPAGRPGLGAHAAEALGIPVIGVAKTPFRGASHAAEVVRGAASRPPYVTAAGGLTIDEAATIVAELAVRIGCPACCRGSIHWLAVVLSRMRVTVTCSVRMPAGHAITIGQDEGYRVDSVILCRRQVANEHLRSGLDLLVELFESTGTSDELHVHFRTVFTGCADDHFTRGRQESQDPRPRFRTPQVRRHPVVEVEASDTPRPEAPAQPLQVGGRVGTVPASGPGGPCQPLENHRGPLTQEPRDLGPLKKLGQEFRVVVHSIPLVGMLDWSNWARSQWIVQVSERTPPGLVVSGRLQRFDG